MESLGAGIFIFWLNYFAAHGDYTIFVEKSQCRMVEEKEKAILNSRFSDFLKENKLRNTPERQAILQRVMHLRDMFEIDDLRQALADDSYYVSAATIYNTLNLLCSCGVLYKHQLDNATSRYQRLIGKSGNQYLICRMCGKIKVVRDPEFLSYVNSKRYNAFSVEQYNVYIYGLCNNCRRRQKKMEHVESAPRQK